MWYDNSDEENQLNDLYGLQTDHFVHVWSDIKLYQSQNRKNKSDKA